MKARIATALLMLALAFSTGCSGPDASGGGGTVASGGGGAPALVVQNRSSQAICFVYISPASQGSWGEDRLGSGETIGPGGSRGWNVPSDHYDVRLEDCDHDVLLDRRGIAVTGDGVLLPLQ